MTDRVHARSGTVWLAVLMGVMGAAAVIGQSLYVREILVAFFGNELTLGVVFGAWLVGVVTGAWIGGKAAARMGRPILWLGAAACVGVVTLPGGLLIARSLRLIAGAEAGSYLPFRWLLIGTALVTIPFSILMGFTFPVAGRAARHREGAPASGISLIYVAEAVGAVAGGLAFSFVLVGRVGPFRIGMSMMALVVIVAVAPAVLRQWRRHRFGRTALREAPAWVALAAAIVAAGPLERLGTSLRWRGIGPGQRLVATADSPYGNIALGEREGQYNLYLDGHLATSFPDDRAFSHTAHLVMCQHPNPKNVLVIGGGIEGLLNATRPHAWMLHCVCLDAAVPRLVYPHIGRANQSTLRVAGVTLFLTDARTYIRTLGQGRESAERLSSTAVYNRTPPGADLGWHGAPIYPGRWRRRREDGVWTDHDWVGQVIADLESAQRQGYDLVVVDLPAPSNAALNRFYTAEFLREVKAVLAKDGVFATSLPTAGPNYRGAEALNYAGSFFHTLRDAFANVVVRPDEDTLWFFAGDGDSVTSNPDVLMKRYEARGIRDDHFHPILFRADFPPDRVESLWRDLMSRADVPRNTDERPITYFYDTMLWGRYSGSRIAGAFRAFERVTFGAALGLCGAVVILWVVTRAMRRTWRPWRLSAAAVWSVAAFGFAAMALELVLLYAYQNLFGVIYERIGAAVALFMAGLAAGGLLSRWFLTHHHERHLDDTGWRFSVRRHTALRESEAGLALTHERERVAAAARRVALAAAAVAALLAGLAVALPWYVQWLARAGGTGWGAEARMLGALVAAGLLTGAMFPLAGRLHLAARRLRPAGHAEPPTDGQIARTAGAIDAADHTGACLGALVTGVVLVPVLGVRQTTLIVAALALTALVLLITSRPRG